MLPDGFAEPVDVSGDSVFGLLAGLPWLGGSGIDPVDQFPAERPDQLRFDGLEEGEEGRGNGPGVFAVRRAPATPFLPRDQPVLAHQACRAMPLDLMAPVDEIAVHAMRVPRAGRLLNPRQQAYMTTGLRSWLDESSVAGHHR